MTSRKIDKKRIGQVLSLYVSMVLTLIVGIGVSVFNTRFLEPQQFGDYKFLQNLFSFIVLFFTIGFFNTGSYLLAQKENEYTSRALTGSILNLAAKISIVFILSLVGISFFQGKIFNNDLGRYIRIFSPFLFVYPLQLCITSILQGTNRIFELSAFGLLPPLLYISVAMAVNYFASFSLFSALLIQFITFSIVIIAVVIYIKPSFKNTKHHLEKIFETNTSYGFPIYIGTIVSVASAQLGGLSVAFFVNTVSVGYFSLAVTITAPLMMIPSVVGTTFFKEFANTALIPKNIIIATVIMSACSLFGFFVIIKWVVITLYSDEYLPVVSLCYLLSAGCVCHGFGDFVNRFLGAHGQGKSLRNSAMVVGTINILGYIFLVKQFGITGAALTRLSADAVYLCMMIFHYQKYKSEFHYAR